MRARPTFKAKVALVRCGIDYGKPAGMFDPVEAAAFLEEYAEQVREASEGG